jgi:hypothetical protein
MISGVSPEGTKARTMGLSLVPKAGGPALQAETVMTNTKSTTPRIIKVLLLMFFLLSLHFLHVSLYHAARVEAEYHPLSMNSRPRQKIGLEPPYLTTDSPPEARDKTLKTMPSQ